MSITSQMTSDVGDDINEKLMDRVMCRMYKYHVKETKTIPRSCPFCGDKPDVSDEGSCIDVECCASMSRQKCDYLTVEERQTYSFDTYRHSDEVEMKVYNLVIAEWNSRV